MQLVKYSAEELLLFRNEITCRCRWRFFLTIYCAALLFNIMFWLLIVLTTLLFPFPRLFLIPFLLIVLCATPHQYLMLSLSLPSSYPTNTHTHPPPSYPYLPTSIWYPSQTFFSSFIFIYIAACIHDVSHFTPLYHLCICPLSQTPSRMVTQQQMQQP